jgi:biotin operon repressor
MSRVGCADAVAAHRQRLRDNGLQISRLHVSWADLEPRPGRYRFDDLEAQLADEPGLRRHLLIETVDSDGLALPKDLVDDAEGYRLAGGLSLADPVVTDRFACLVDALMPRLDGEAVFAISVANEPDARLDDVDPSSAEGLAWVDDLAAFTAGARDHLHLTRTWRWG